MLLSVSFDLLSLLKIKTSEKMLLEHKTIIVILIFIVFSDIHIAYAVLTNKISLLFTQAWCVCVYRYLYLIYIICLKYYIHIFKHIFIFIIYIHIYRNFHFILLSFMITFVFNYFFSSIVIDVCSLLPRLVFLQFFNMCISVCVMISF